jgi:F-type H+-transporting ATPase subunit b
VSIDVFTTVAQMVNFLVLVVLLRRFLYKPIVRTMDRRELLISDRIHEAVTSEARAKREAEACHAQRQELEDRRSEILADAQEEALAWKREIMQQAREEAEDSKARWEMAIEREKQTFLHELRRRAGEEVYAVARRALRDLADVDLERHIVDVFIKRLGSISGADWTDIATAGVRSEEGIKVISAFPLDGDTRSRIRAAVERELDRHVTAAAVPSGVLQRFEMAFDQSADLICGIELRAGGRRAAWSLQNYLESLEENLSLAFRSAADLESPPEVE